MKKVTIQEIHDLFARLMRQRLLRCAPDDLSGLVEQNEGRFRSHLDQLLSH